MTNIGLPTPITYVGITRQPVGFLSKASFQRPMDTFLGAALYGKSEKTFGTSIKIFLGQPGEFGPGRSRLALTPRGSLP